MEALRYSRDEATSAQIAEHLTQTDADFLPPLSARVTIPDYADKIAQKAVRFEAWAGTALVGLLAAYCNDAEKRVAFITSVSVVKEWTGRNIAANLLHQLTKYAMNLGMRSIVLEVNPANLPAIGLYRKAGFTVTDTGDASLKMNLPLGTD